MKSILSRWTLIILMSSWLFLQRHPQAKLNSFHVNIVKKGLLRKNTVRPLNHIVFWCVISRVELINWHSLLIYFIWVFNSLCHKHHIHTDQKCTLNTSCCHSTFSQHYFWNHVRASENTQGVGWVVVAHLQFQMWTCINGHPQASLAGVTWIW